MKKDTDAEMEIEGKRWKVWNVEIKTQPTHIAIFMSTYMYFSGALWYRSSWCQSALEIRNVSEVTNCFGRYFVGRANFNKVIIARVMYSNSFLNLNGIAALTSSYPIAFKIAAILFTIWPQSQMWNVLAWLWSMKILTLLLFKSPQIKCSQVVVS